MLICHPTQHSVRRGGLRAGLDYCLRFAESQHCQGGILGAPRAQYKKAHRFIHPTNPTPGFAGTPANGGKRKERIPQSLGDGTKPCARSDYAVPEALGL